MRQLEEARRDCEQISARGRRRGRRSERGFGRCSGRSRLGVAAGRLCRRRSSSSDSHGLRGAEARPAPPVPDQGRGVPGRGLQLRRRLPGRDLGSRGGRRRRRRQKRARKKQSTTAEQRNNNNTATKRRKQMTPISKMNLQHHKTHTAASR